MELVFGTTSERKVKDLENIVNELNLDIKVLSMADIGWDRGEIEEDGDTLEANSLIKAEALLDFCKDHNLEYPIIADDAGLFVDALGGEPGIYTARYADDERKENPELPKHQCVIKLDNREARYKCCVTTMMPDGNYYQEIGVSEGKIADEIMGDLTKPYFYAVFIVNGSDVVFNKLQGNELDDTYRYKALRKALKRL